MADGSTVAARSTVMSVSVGLVGLMSHGCTLLMAHLLTPAEYIDYAAGQMLLGMVGVVGAALTPLPLVHLVRSHPPGSEGRRQGMAFAGAVSASAGIVAAIVTGAVAAIVTGAVAAAFAPPIVVSAVSLSALLLFLITPAEGWLLGELRFARYAVA